MDQKVIRALTDATKYKHVRLYEKWRKLKITLLGQFFKITSSRSDEASPFRAGHVCAPHWPHTEGRQTKSKLPAKKLSQYQISTLVLTLTVLIT